MAFLQSIIRANDGGQGNGAGDANGTKGELGGEHLGRDKAKSRTDKLHSPFKGAPHLKASSRPRRLALLSRSFLIRDGNLHEAKTTRRTKRRY